MTDSVLALFIGIDIGFTLGALYAVHLRTIDCADCHVGSADYSWWRKAVAIAEFRKSEKEKP